MIRTLKDKLKYNAKRKTNFAFGYCLGVSMYKDYLKDTAKGKLETKRLIDNFKILACGGDEISKGVMCGVRDAANERKRK